jgi:subtilisin family serine protease
LLSSGEFIAAPTDLAGENPDPAMRPHVVNNSWGGGATTDPWYQPVQAWIAAGIFPQFASGDLGSACGAAGNPGSLPESYAAGAFDINDNIASFSSRGPSAWGSDIIKPNLAAPGVNVRSSVPGGGYSSFNGTSMASPHVSGVVALMWSAAIAIERDIEATKDLLDVSAEDTESLTCGGMPENHNVWGQGKLDAYAPVDQSPRGPTGLLSGTVTDAATGDPIGGAHIEVTGEDHGDLAEDQHHQWPVGEVGEDLQGPVQPPHVFRQQHLRAADGQAQPGRWSGLSESGRSP